MELEKVFSIINGQENDMVEFMGKLVATVAVGPDNRGPGEMDKAALVSGFAASLGFKDILWINAPDDRVATGHRPNFMVRLPGGSRSPVVWAISHLDVVPAGDESLWSSDPFALRREGDRLYGRGAEDNHQGIVTTLFALGAIMDAGLGPKGEVRLLFVSDEETGSQRGLAHVIDARPDLFDPSHLIVIPDYGKADGAGIEVAEKSILWLKVTVTGKQCHASAPHRGNNSLVAAARMILGLSDLKERFPRADELFSPPRSTLEPTKMEANVENINTIPGKDVFHMDCRLLPGLDPEEVLAAAREVARDVAQETGVEVAVDKVLAQRAAPPTSPDARVVKALKRAARRAAGIEARPMGIGGGTVAAVLRNRGLECAVWATQEGTAHQPDEYCLLSNLVRDAKVLAHLFLDP